MNHQSTHIPRRSIATRFMILLHSLDASLTVSNQLAMPSITALFISTMRNLLHSQLIATIISRIEEASLVYHHPLVVLLQSAFFVWINSIVMAVRLIFKSPIRCPNRPIVLMYCFKQSNDESLYILAEGDASGSLHQTAHRAYYYFRHLSDFSGYASM